MKSRFILFFLSLLITSTSLVAQTAPTFSKTTIDPSIDEIYDVFPADLDKDGDQDIVGLARNGFGAGVVAWYENDGNSNPTFTKILIDSITVSPRSLYVVDIDEDDDLDIIAVFQINGFSGATNIFWYENDGATDPSFTRQALGSVKGLARDLDVADIDNDGDLDIAVSDNDGSGSAGFAYESVTWFESDGAADPSFTKRLIDVNYRFAESIRIGDMDGDNDLDIVVGSTNSDDIAWYENNGAADPSFSKNFIDQNALGIEQLELADLDDDGDLDVVWTDNFSDYIAWSRNNGEVNPTFTEFNIQNYNASALVAVADMDLDGDLDIVSGSFLEDDVYWYESNGAASPTFIRHEIDSLLDQPQRVRIADMDGNGSPDIVGAAFRADDVMWYENSLLPLYPDLSL
ncbi:MAG: FG-GAP repeat domain-containing protein [Balneola sp.]